MKIAFIANRIPFPPFRGDKLKIYNLARRLSVHHDLYLITFVQSKDEYKYKDELMSIFKEVHLVYQPFYKSLWQCVLAIFTGQSFQLAYFRNRKMADAISNFYRIQKVDVTHIQHLRMSQYHRYVVGKSILDLPDAYSLYWQRRISVQRKWFNQIFDRIESRRVIREEEVIKDFRLSLVCSAEDRDFLIHKHGVKRIELLPNGVDLDQFVYENHDYHQTTLLFTGNMDYAPNVDAVVYFVHQQWKKIKKQFPDVKLIIAGQRPVRDVLLLESSDIQVTGFVPDISKMYTKAGIVIAPLRFGAGTQNKVLEAMAMGVPVVCTSIGFAGLGIESGQGCLLSMNDEEFVSNVVSLLSSNDMREKVGQKGLEVVRTKFSWDIITKQLEDYFKKVIHE